MRDAFELSSDCELDEDGAAFVLSLFWYWEKWICVWIELSGILASVR